MYCERRISADHGMDIMMMSIVSNGRVCKAWNQSCVE